MFAHVLGSRHFKEQSYKACLGLKNLASAYSNDRFENACGRALKGIYINYGTIKNILENNLDGQNSTHAEAEPAVTHANIRPAGSYI